MCEKPYSLPNGQVVSCGRCNECISVRKMDWVSRAVAETGTQPFGLVVNLSYDTSDGSSDGALTFRYRDVQNFMKRLRSAMKEATGETQTLRYIVCGERGSARGRVHWHCVLWSTVKLTDLGEWADFASQWSAGIPPSAGPKKEHQCAPVLRQRLVWSQWPWGHVFLDEVTQEGIAYVLKYALKDQFQASKTRGTRREGQGEVNASSFFRMSKEPPIGAGHLDKTIQRWKHIRQVPPDLRIRVPGLKGNWYPRRALRLRLLQGLVEILNHSLMAVGKPPAGWAAAVDLLCKTEAGLKDLETIGEMIDGLPETHQAQQAAHVVAYNREVLGYTDAREREKTSPCRGIFPCQKCFAGLTDGELVEAFQRAVASRERFRIERKRAEAEGRRFVSWVGFHAQRQEINPFCRHDEGGAGGAINSGPTNAEETFWRWRQGEDIAGGFCRED